MSGVVELQLWLLLAGLSDFGVSEVGVWVGLPELSGEGDLKALIGWVPPSLALFLLCSNFLRNEDWRAEGRSSRGGTIGGNVSAPSGLGLWSLSNALR